MAKLCYYAVFRHKNSHDETVLQVLSLKGWIKNVDELRSRILTAWDELDQKRWMLELEDACEAKSAALTILELLAFNAQKFRRSCNPGHPLFKKF